MNSLKVINPADPVSINDLMSKDGFVLSMGDEIPEDTEDLHPYRPNVDLSNDQMIKLLNMEEFGEDDDENVTDADAMSPWTISFSKIKSKSHDLTKDGKVMKLIKRDGIGEVIPANSMVTIHYGGYFEYQDEPYDSTYAQGHPISYRLREGGLIPGLDLGISTMKKHEIACFVIHPEYAFGELGCEPLVPANAEVLFIVYLIDYVDGGAADNIQNLSAEERLQFKNAKVAAARYIHIAADSYKRRKTRQAIREYVRAKNILERAKLDNDEEEEEYNKMLSRVYGNLAICFNKEDKPRQACSSCLSVPNPTAKTHFNHGRALLKMGEYEMALEKLHIALRDEPKNTLVINEIQLANELQMKYLKAEKSMWANCLKVRDGKKEVDEYAKIAKEFCLSFVENNGILRQPFPVGLTPVEDKCIREQAALLGITVEHQLRYGKETTYLTKTNY